MLALAFIEFLLGPAGASVAVHGGLSVLTASKDIIGRGSDLIKSDREASSTNENSNPTPRGTAGKLEKQPRGKGSVPPSERPKPRMPRKAEQRAQYENDGGMCRNCANETAIEQTSQHHDPKRHADGGSSTVTVCKTCHEKHLHRK